MAFRKQRLKDDQQVEVSTAKIDFMHVHSAYYQLDSWSSDYHCRDLALAHIGDHMKRTALFFLAIGTALAVGQQIATSRQSADARIADLVQAGKLRAGIGVVAPHWAVKDSRTGELRGVAVDVARALATRMGIELAVIEYPSPPNVLEGLKTGAWDVGFLAIDPSRAAVVDFSSPYLQIDATYLVREGSSIRMSADADQPGIRIAVTRKSVEQIVLKRSLKQAQLQEVDTIPAGFELLRAGNADALAAPRPALLQFSGRLPGSRVLEDRFHAAFGSIAVPKGQIGRLSYVDEFVEEAKASRLVHQAIEHAGVRGVQVAPQGNRSTP
jgi:polar amino acid transport system substrate-binding protein